MAWIESHQSLGTHRKLYHLADLLHIDETRAVGLLHYLWWWCLDNAPDGDITDLPEKTIAKACHWKKSPTLLLTSLCNSKWIDNEVGLKIHDWDDYAGKLIQARIKNKEKQRTYRERQGNVTVMSRSRSRSTVPNSTVPNSNKEEVEEENSLSDNNLAEISKIYENNIGALTPIVADELKILSDEYSTEWFSEATKEACNANARKLNYIKSILKRWKTDGFKSPKENRGTDRGSARKIPKPGEYTKPPGPGI